MGDTDLEMGHMTKRKSPFIPELWATTAGEGVASTGPKGGLALKPLWLNTTWLWFFNKTLPTNGTLLFGMDSSSGLGSGTQGYSKMPAG